MSNYDALFPRRPLILGEARALDTQKPFQYKYSNRNEVVNSTGVLLRTIYGDSSHNSYSKFTKDFELRNCLDIELAEGEFIKNEIAAIEFLEKQANEASKFSPSVFQEDFLTADRSVVKSGLPLFFGRRVFFLGQVNVVFFERILAEKDLNLRRKNRNETLFLSTCPKEPGKSVTVDIRVAFSIITLYHPSKNWRFQYKDDELRELGDLFRHSTRTWQFDWDYDEGKMIRNRLLEE